MTAKTKSERLKRLLSHGYFAPELPPCFVSDDLAKYRRSIISGIDSLPVINRNPAFHKFISEPVRFYFPRFGKEDRLHGVPNPFSHLLLARTIANNYVDLRRRAKASRLSLSQPVFDWSGTRALMRTSVDSRDTFRINLSSRREEYAIGDIRAFFHSIYTHAIAWSIYGKTWAKQNRSNNHYGNLIDLLCRNSQDGQTIGLIVGPDTSRLLAEVVASAIDVELQNRLGAKQSDASRYIDDFTISNVEGKRGEELLAALRQSAAVFELELNNDKSTIVPTSQRQNTGWKQAVRSHIPSLPATSDEIQRFFYELGQLCLQHPELNIEKFGLQNSRSALVLSEHWDIIQPNLISAYRRNPSLVSLLAEICILRQATKRDVKLSDLCEFVENRIPVLTSTNRTGEVVWLLFLSIRLNLTLSAQKLAPLFKIENALVAVLVSCLDAKALVNGAVDRTLWDQSLTTSGLRSSMWLYAYEAVNQSFVPDCSDTFITTDPYFKLLHAKRIKFFDIEMGFTSINDTLKKLRAENQRMRRVWESFRDEDIEDIDEVDDDDNDDY